VERDAFAAYATSWTIPLITGTRFFVSFPVHAPGHNYTLSLPLRQCFTDTLILRERALFSENFLMSAQRGAFWRFEAINLTFFPRGFRDDISFSSPERLL
jgi:hypothetical protein